MARRWRACCIVVVVCLVTVGAGVAVPSAAPRAHAANGKARDVHPPASAKRARHAEVPPGDFSRAHPGRSNGAAPKHPFDRSKATEDGHTPKADVYRNPDGTRTALIHARPVNYQDAAGSWHKMDSSLVAQPDGSYANASGPVSFHLAGQTGPGELVSLAKDAWHLGFSVSGASSGRPGKVKGNGIRYPGVLANVDLEERVHDDTLKETIWLNAPPSAGSPTTFSFPLTLVGLRAQADAHGGVAIYDASGTRILSLPNGVATDSSGDVAQGNTAKTATTVSLGGSPATPTVEVAVDPAWLNDPARVYPVSIDPNILWDAGRQSGHTDAFVSTGCTGCNYNGNNQVAVHDSAVTSNSIIILYYTDAGSNGNAQAITAQGWGYFQTTGSPNKCFQYVVLNKAP